MMTETYEAVENAEGTITAAYFSRGMEGCYLDEWFGRPAADFDRGMNGRGFAKQTTSEDRYRGTVKVHTYSRRVA